MALSGGVQEGCGAGEDVRYPLDHEGEREDRRVRGCQGRALADQLSRALPLIDSQAGRALGGYKRLLGRTRTLKSHASRVRKKLCVGSEDRFIVNVWGVGYRMLD